MKVDAVFAGIEAMESEIETLECWGATLQAEMLARACDQFRTILTDWLDEALSPTAAAEECDWEGGTIAKKIRAGELPQAGEAGRPLVRRADLHGITFHGATPELEAWAREMVTDNV